MFKSTHKVKKFLSLLFVICIFSANVPQASARSLGVGNRTQAKSNWCWVACAEMIGRYYGYTNSQSEICRRTIGNTDNEIATIYTASRAIQIATNELVTSVVYRPLTEAEVTREINADREPFEIRVGWNGSLTNGHFIVCDGYSSNSSLEICNPLDGNNIAHDYDYEKLKSGLDITGGYGIWSHTTIIST